MQDVLAVDDILEYIVSQAQTRDIWVAYSGGLDSHVLLHVLATSKVIDLTRLHAIHINHGLQPDSASWAQHCIEQAKQLGIACLTIDVDVEGVAALGLEAAARAARYQAIEQALTSNDIVLTAQHQHDQAETLLLQLLRGAGPKGLAAMAVKSQLKETTLLRPLLSSQQSTLLHYAEQYQLNWIEDPSNQDTRWNRNYIRHRLWPVIEQRWPSAVSVISRSAQHCAETTELLNTLAEHDCAELKIKQSDKAINITALLSLSAARYKNILRHYIEKLKFPLPSTGVLQRIIDEVCLAKQDATPLVSWSGIEARRYQSVLYFMKALPEHNAELSYPIDNVDIAYPLGLQRLVWRQEKGRGIRQSMVTSDLSIRFRTGGETILLKGQQHTKSLKHLFQEWAIPPWLRDRVPLIYHQQVLIAVVGYGQAEAYSVTEEERGLIPEIEIGD